MATYSSSSTIAAEVTHLSGTPPCGSKPNDANASNEAFLPTGGLFGGISLINVLSGTDFTHDAVALDNGSARADYARAARRARRCAGHRRKHSRRPAKCWRVVTCTRRYGSRRRRHPRLRLTLTQ
jgi:hypothetical protein